MRTWNCQWHGPETLPQWLALLAQCSLPQMVQMRKPCDVGDLLEYREGTFRVVRPADQYEIAAALAVNGGGSVTGHVYVIEPIATQGEVDAVARQLLATVQPTTLDYKAALALFAAKAKSEMTGAAVIEACRPLKQPGVMEEAFAHIEVLFTAMHKYANGQKLTQTEIIQAFGDLLTLREASQAVWS